MEDNNHNSTLHTKTNNEKSKNKKTTNCTDINGPENIKDNENNIERFDPWKDIIFSEEINKIINHQNKDNFSWFSNFKENQSDENYCKNNEKLIPYPIPLHLISTTPSNQYDECFNHHSIENSNDQKFRQLTYNSCLSLSDEKNIQLFDLNYYFKRVNKVFENIDELSEQIKEKQEEADFIVQKIENKIISLLGEEAICYIEEDINTLGDLIGIAKKYGTPTPKMKFSVDVKILYRLIDPLEKLRDIVGMTKIKDQIIDQIITSMQNLYENDIRFHTVIKGPPGVGKTLLAKILGEIYLNIGILKNNENRLIFKIAKRSDLIGKYLGHTAIKTQDFIDSCEGGVMFIDEVYSLGNNEKKDSFSKECIDTLNLNLTEKTNFICIVAGYSDEIENCFFSYNPGLKRRFPFCYDIQGYSAVELRDIFLTKIHKSGWNLEEELNDNIQKLDTFFTKKKNDFNNYGGDIDTFILNAKIAHGRRVFGKDGKIKRIINMEDIEKGYDKFILTKKKNENETMPFSIRRMYI